MVFFLDDWMEKKQLKSYNRLILKFIMHMDLGLNFIFALKKGVSLAKYGKGLYGLCNKVSCPLISH